MKPARRNHGAISWMAKNPVAANLLMITVLVGGLLVSQRMRKEVFPQVSLDQIVVSVPYPGASPAEVEQGILLAVEEVVRPLDGIKRVRSSATEGLGTVTAELELGVDANKVLANVKNAVDRLTSLPQEAERPQVSLPELRAEAISLVLAGPQDEGVLRTLADQIREELLQLPEVTTVELDGTRPREISIEITQDTLRTYGLTLSQIADQVRRTAIELPGGQVKTKGGEILLRTAERRARGAEFASIPIVTSADGSTLRLGDVATIKDGFAETDLTTTYNGQPALLIKVYSVGDQSPTEVGQAVKRFAKTRATSLPQGVSMSIWQDLTEIFDQRVDLLMRNSATGLVLVLLILGVFLEPKLAFWVSMGIPTSFLGALFLLPVFDVSINMISLFAFIVTLGMVVDDAIVVGENAYHLRRAGLSPLAAAIRGAKEMATPVFFSIATTIAAFFPLLFIPGTHGKLAVCIPLIVILVLLLSLIESFFVLPAHLGHMREGRLARKLAPVLRIQERISLAVERFIANYYGPVVRLATRQRWITLALSVTILLATLGLVSGGRVKFVDFPKEEADWVVAEAKLPFAASVEETRQVAARLIQAAQKTAQQSGEPTMVKGMLATIGSAGGRFGPADQSSSVGSNRATVTVLLVPADQRTLGSVAFAEKWRQQLGELPGLDSITYSSTLRGSTKPIDLELSHPELQVLETAAMELGAQLERVMGVHDVDTGVERGKPQLDFTLRPDGESAGLTAHGLGAQVRAAFYGEEVLRQQRGRDEVKVVVRLTRRERELLQSVEQMVIRAPQGDEMALRQAATIHAGHAYTAINRKDGHRYLRVQADVDEALANPQEVTTALQQGFVPQLLERYPGLVFGYSGRQQETQDFFTYIVLGYIMALIAIYGLLAVPLRSYLQPPLVVMAAIPFGLVGAILGHLVMGMDLSIFSIMGVVALGGVVVNDSIVLTTTANTLRDEGCSAMEAAILASQRRFRPILLTTLTTFGGLAPMIFETSLQARMIVPMAVSLGFGIMISTLFVLLLVPALYVLTENLRQGYRQWRDVPANEALPAAEENP